MFSNVNLSPSLSAGNKKHVFSNVNLSPSLPAGNFLNFSKMFRTKKRLKLKAPEVCNYKSFSSWLTKSLFSLISSCNFRIQFRMQFASMMMIDGWLISSIRAQYSLTCTKNGDQIILNKIWLQVTILLIMFRVLKINKSTSGNFKSNYVSTIVV